MESEYSVLCVLPSLASISRRVRDVADHEILRFEGNCDIAGCALDVEATNPVTGYPMKVHCVGDDGGHSQRPRTDSA